MAKRRKLIGVWVDENTFVEKDGTTHKAVPYVDCAKCSLFGDPKKKLTKGCKTSKCKENRCMFAKVQKLEVDKCKL